MATSDGSLCGQNKWCDDKSGLVKAGTVLSLEADLHNGTLKFWADGKPHGTGYTSGVHGRLRWAVCLANKEDAVQLVPTPPLE